jgi:hypothetical protein
MAAKPEKIDLWAEHKSLFSPKAGRPELVRVPPLTYLMVDGTGDPNTSEAFRAAIGALYSLAYTLKFSLKKSRGLDFRVMPLDGRFHAEDPRVFLEGHKQEWRWTLMLVLPSQVTAADVKQARALAQARQKASPALPLVRRRCCVKACAPRSCTSVPTPPRVPPSRRCTPSSPKGGWPSPAATTRSTFPTPTARRRPG